MRERGGGGDKGNDRKKGRGEGKWEKEGNRRKMREIRELEEHVRKKGM